MPLALEDFDSNCMISEMLCDRTMDVSNLREHSWGGGGGRHVDRLWIDSTEPMPFACAKRANRGFALNRVGAAKRKRQDINCMRL
jgi:hypothetical protein